MTIQRLLSINADVSIDVGDNIVWVRGNGSQLVMEVPSLALALKLLRTFPATLSVRKRVAQLARLLSGVGLTIVIRTPTRRLMTVGCEGNSWLLKLIGIRHVKLHLN